MTGLAKKRAGMEAVAVNGGGAAVAGMILEGPSSRIVPRKPRRVKTDHVIRVFGRPEDPPEIALPLPPRPECGAPGENFWEDAARDPSLLQMLQDPEHGRRILEERRGEIPEEIPSEKSSQRGLTRPSSQVYNQIKKKTGGQKQMNMNETTNNLNNLLGSEGAAVEAQGYVLVLDGATGAVYPADQASSLAERWEEEIRKAESLPEGEDRDYARLQAYSLACSATAALREDEVPPAVAQALREESGHSKLTWGW